MFWMQPITIPENKTYTIPQGHIVFYPDTVFPIEGTLYIQEGASLILAGTLSVAASGNVINEGTLIENALDGTGTHDHDTRYYTKAQTDVTIDGKLAGYYTKAQTDVTIDGKLDNHYLKSETDSLLAGKSNTGHTHPYSPTSHDHDERYKRKIVSEGGGNAGEYEIAYNIGTGNARVSGLFHIRFYVGGSHWSYLVWASSHYNGVDGSYGLIKVFAAHGFGGNPVSQFFIRKRGRTSDGSEVYGDTLFLMSTNRYGTIKIELLTNSNIEDLTQWYLDPNIYYPDTSGWTNIASVPATAPEHYTESEVNSLLAGKAPASHTHNYAPASHTHSFAETTGLDDWGTSWFCLGAYVAHWANDRDFVSCTLSQDVKHNGSYFNHPDLRVCHKGHDNIDNEGSRNVVVYISGAVKMEDLTSSRGLMIDNNMEILKIAELPSTGYYKPLYSQILTVPSIDHHGNFGQSIAQISPDGNIHIIYGGYEYLFFNNIYHRL